MYIVIIGAGEVGSYVARMLVAEGHDVAVVELDPGLSRRLDATLNALVIGGSGLSPAVLERAGVGRADLLLAVTATDEVNLIACMTARKYGGERLRTVARVRQSQRLVDEPALTADDLGLDALISPEQAIATTMMDALRYAGSGEMRELAGGKLLLVGMVLGPDSPLVHERLADLRGDFPGDFLVVAAQGRDGVRIPTGADKLQVDDRAFVLTLPENLTELAILSGQPWHRVERILIVGCGNTGLALARELEAQASKTRPLSLTIIEKDQDRAGLVADALPRALVVNADGSEPEILRSRIEEDRIDAVVVLLDDPEKSVLIGIFAKSLGARKVIVRCDKPAYGHLTRQLGVDAIISPNRAMIDAILRYVRRGKVESTLMLGEHEAELIEFRVADEPVRRELITRPLRDLGFPPGVLVGAAIRGDNAFLPTGDTVLCPGDELFVACRAESVDALEKMFA